MIISHIVAVANDGVIGYGNTMPWSVEGELDRFVRLTMNKTVLMGKNTYYSLPTGLPGRQLAIISKTLPTSPNYRLFGSLEEALAALQKVQELFIIGGGQLYEATLPIIDKLYLTRLHLDVEGDTYYPIDALNQFTCVFQQSHRTNASFVYETYLRRY